MTGQPPSKEKTSSDSQLIFTQMPPTLTSDTLIAGLDYVNNPDVYTQFGADVYRRTVQALAELATRSGLAETEVQLIFAAYGIKSSRAEAPFSPGFISPALQDTVISIAAGREKSINQAEGEYNFFAQKEPGPMSNTPVDLMTSLDKAGKNPKALAVGGKISAHGIAKGPHRAQFNSLFHILNNGVDKTRRFDSIPLLSTLDAGTAAVTYGATNAFTEGDFIICSKENGKLEADGVRFVILAPHYDFAINLFRNVWPHIDFVRTSDLENYLVSSKVV